MFGHHFLPSNQSVSYGRYLRMKGVAHLRVALDWVRWMMNDVIFMREGRFIRRFWGISNPEAYIGSDDSR